MARTAVLTGCCLVAWVGSGLPAQTRHASRALEVLVTADDTVLTRSCRIRIPKGTVIRDRNGNGVLQIRANHIHIEFTEGSVLRGAKPGTPADGFTGVGIRLDGRKDVSIQNARVQGYKAGMHLSRANGLVLSGCDVSGNYRQRLRSTPQSEDTADWLRPHDNDDHQWLRHYGAGVYVERSQRVHVRNNRVRRGQNGIVLDRVENSFVYDNDCSFLSGWGLALWRSSGNTITRNAFDFCIRGYSHGVYNRGQDSAGILMFEQCSGNVIAENSVTHGGDGLFGHAGNEALGQVSPKAKDFDYQRRGNNDNLILANDLSYAAAHGLEMTFSFGNKIYLNRLVDNAICGIWAGYSQDTHIGKNVIRDNGERGYGLERGGINIEHGASNLIHDNEFANNKCGVHLWDDDDVGLLKLPWARKNHRGCVDNHVLNNQFDGDAVALHLRGAKRTWFSGNKLQRVKEDVVTTAGAEPNRRVKEPPQWRLPKYNARGKTRPVGARQHLRGRDKIILDEWGPWDHDQPMVRWAGVVDGGHRYEVFGVKGKLTARLLEGDDRHLRLRREATAVEVSSSKSGVHPYLLAIEAAGLSRRIRSRLLSIRWQVRVFPWTVDPRKDVDAWHAEARKHGLQVNTGSLDLNYGHGGPRQLNLSPAITKKGPGPDRFGTIADTKVRLPKGTWKVVTRSDDGIRVWVDGERILDNWTHHGPTTDHGEFRVDVSREVSIRVEHFEIDGYALLNFDLRRVN